MLLKEKTAYQFWLTLYRSWPRVERFGLGQQIEQTFLLVLELTFASSYLPPDQKIVSLSRVIVKLDSLKFFMQLAWESKLMTTNQYADLSQQLEEIGRQLGGWRKGLQKKTPAK